MLYNLPAYPTRWHFTLLTARWLIHFQGVTSIRIFWCLSIVSGFGGWWPGWVTDITDSYECIVWLDRSSKTNVLARPIRCVCVCLYTCTWRYMSARAHTLVSVCEYMCVYVYVCVRVCVWWVEKTIAYLLLMMRFYMCRGIVKRNKTFSTQTETQHYNDDTIPGPVVAIHYHLVVTVVESFASHKRPGRMKNNLLYPISKLFCLFWGRMCFREIYFFSIIYLFV